MARISCYSQTLPSGQPSPGPVPRQTCNETLGIVFLHLDSIQIVLRSYQKFQVPIDTGAYRQTNINVIFLNSYFYY